MEQIISLSGFIRIIRGQFFGKRRELAPDGRRGQAQFFQLFAPLCLCDFALKVLMSFQYLQTTPLPVKADYLAIPSTRISAFQVSLSAIALAAVEAFSSVMEGLPFDCDKIGYRNQIEDSRLQRNGGHHRRAG